MFALLEMTPIFIKGFPSSSHGNQLQMIFQGLIKVSSKLNLCSNQ